MPSRSERTASLRVAGSCRRVYPAEAVGSPHFRQDFTLEGHPSAVGLIVRSWAEDETHTHSTQYHSHRLLQVRAAQGARVPRACMLLRFRMLQYLRAARGCVRVPWRLEEPGATHVLQPLPSPAPLPHLSLPHLCEAGLSSQVWSYAPPRPSLPSHLLCSIRREWKAG